MWLSSGKRITEITVFGVCWRRFMFGYKSVPPATNCASGPAAALIFTASATLRGTRYSKNGKRIMVRVFLLRMDRDVRQLTAVATFGRRQDPLWFGPGDRGHGGRAIASVVAAGFFAQSLQNLLWGDG